MSRNVVVVDYGASNLLSVLRAFRHLGVEVDVAARPNQLDGASHLVLPGVGAFGAAMEALALSDMIDPITAHARAGKPFLGICLGMQMMMQESEEFGFHRGLGLIPGRVVPVPPTGADGARHRIPHIGWAPLIEPRPNGWVGSILEGLEPVPLYFVHSYMAVPDDDSHRLADVDYDGRMICAAIRADNITGFQGHPEKSGARGLVLLKRFVES